MWYEFVCIYRSSLHPSFALTQSILPGDHLPLQDTVKVPVLAWFLHDKAWELTHLLEHVRGGTQNLMFFCGQPPTIHTCLQHNVKGFILRKTKVYLYFVLPDGVLAYPNVTVTRVKVPAELMRWHRRARVKDLAVAVGKRNVAVMVYVQHVASGDFVPHRRGLSGANVHVLLDVETIQLGIRPVQKYRTPTASVRGQSVGQAVTWRLKHGLANVLPKVIVLRGFNDHSDLFARKDHSPDHIGR